MGPLTTVAAAAFSSHLDSRNVRQLNGCDSPQEQSKAPGFESLYASSVAHACFVSHSTAGKRKRLHGNNLLAFLTKR